MRRTTCIASVTLVLGLAASGLGPVASAGPSPTSAGTPAVSRQAPNPGKIRTDGLSSGGKAYFQGPNRDGGAAPASATAGVSFGSNVDANNPQKDFASGQSETAIAAAGQRVMAAWNDATGFLVSPSTYRRASLTGVGYSSNGGRTFTDLIGLPNDNPNQQWFGDPTVVAVDNGRNFIVGSLYLPSFQFDCSKAPAKLELAVSVATVSSTGSVRFADPVVVARGGNVCKLFTPDPPPPDLAFLDKEWLGYDQSTRTLVMSYTRFFFGFGGQSGTGQIEMVRAHVPANPSRLRTSDFSRPIVVWPEEREFVVNQGAYVSVAPGGDAYVSWERNWISNLFNGTPRVFIHAARVRRGDSSPTVGGPRSPRVVSLGQLHSSPNGGVKSLDAVAIAGYNRGLGNDFPRVAVNAPLNKVVFVWNDASKHPLGDIWMRALPMNLDISGPIVQVNDDNSYALHFLPAVSIRGDGSVATSWYDRRLSGPDSTRTDYFGEVRGSPTGNGRDFRITTGSTNWNGTSTLISPNFGDYTDNASTGGTTYFTWSDGRIGVPQPFVDSH